MCAGCDVRPSPEWSRRCIGGVEGSVDRPGPSLPQVSTTEYVMIEPDEIGGGDATPEPRQVPPITAPVHGLTRYLRVRLEVTDGVLRWEVPRTLLGVVPVGVRHISMPVADVQSLQVHPVVRPFNLVVGAVCIVVPLVLGLWWVAAPMLLLGAWVVLVSLGPRLDVVTHSGAKDHASVCLSHQLDAELYMAAVSDLAEQARERR